MTAMITDAASALWVGLITESGSEPVFARR
jgi:hypothetical protein